VCCAFDLACGELSRAADTLPSKTISGFETTSRDLVFNYFRVTSAADLIHYCQIFAQGGLDYIDFANLQDLSAFL
jgi:hypothetical protein